MKIYLEEGQRPEESLLAVLKKAGEFLLSEEGVDCQRAQISLTLAEPDEIKELNAIYRGVDAVTDVLSFPQFEDMNSLPEEGELCLGDVVVCREKVIEQAEEYGHSQERELVYLFVHSMLHLIGYDHMEEDEKAEMRRREEHVMEHVGLCRQ